MIISDLPNSANNGMSELGLKAFPLNGSSVRTSVGTLKVINTYIFHILGNLFRIYLSGPIIYAVLGSA